MLFTQRDRGHLGVGEEIGVKLEICQVANLCRDGHCILSMIFFSGWIGKVKMRKWKWKSESEKTKVKKVRVKSENVVMKRRTPYFVRFSCLRFLLASSDLIHYTKRAKFPPSKVIYKPFCVFKDQVHSQEPHPPLSFHRWSISPARWGSFVLQHFRWQIFTQQRSKSRARHTADHLSRALSYQELNLLANRS